MKTFAKEDKPTVIHIKDGTIKYGFYYYSNEEEGLLSVYIPAYDIAFTAPNKEEAAKRVEMFVNSFFDTYIKQFGWKEFILKLHKLGFKTSNHDFKIKQLLSNRIANTKFQNLAEPNPAFMGEKSQRFSVEHEIAA